MLDLTFTAEQEMLRETVRGVCATNSPLSVVREFEDDPVGYPPELWKQLAHLDLIGLLLPEEYGGSGDGCPRRRRPLRGVRPRARTLSPLRRARSSAEERSPEQAPKSSAASGSRRS